ncbi:hypothetical protein IAS59_006334 [Cryptococcus gattii]
MLRTNFTVTDQTHQLNYRTGIIRIDESCGDSFHQPTRHLISTDLPLDGEGLAPSIAFPNRLYSVLKVCIITVTKRLPSVLTEGRKLMAIPLRQATFQVASTVRALILSASINLPLHTDLRNSAEPLISRNVTERE